MGKLIYSAITSLDGYIADGAGNFDWGEPDAQVHGYLNDLERSASVHLYGRKLYEVLAVWEDFYERTDLPQVYRDYASLWHRARKIVFSRTLTEAATARTTVESSFDPAAIRRLKAETAGDLVIGGAELAGQALLAGLVDELNLVISPILVGGGKRALPKNFTATLELGGQRRFANGVVHLAYTVTGAAALGSGHQTPNEPAGEDR